MYAYLSLYIYIYVYVCNVRLKQITVRLKRIGVWALPLRLDFAPI